MLNQTSSKPAPIIASTGAIEMTMGREDKAREKWPREGLLNGSEGAAVEGELAMDWKLPRAVQLLRRFAPISDRVGPVLGDLPTHPESRRSA